MVEYPLLLNTFTDLLKKDGLKFTRQREAILRALYDHEGHFSPEEVHRLVSQANPELNVGIATVYRTLSLLESAGLVESISFGKDGKKYEIGLKKHHDHLVCTSCGKIIEFTDETIEERQRIIARTYDFEMTDHTMKIIGLCSQCRQKQS
jgi:Fur family ferric uptake transcriptional regulator